MAINNKRIVLGPKKRFEILRRDNFTCRYCGRKPPEVVLEVDHTIPVAKGGPSDPLNLHTACKGCNTGKGATLLVDDESIQQSRDLLEMSRGELELLERTVKWCQELAEARRKQKEIIIANLEVIAGREFNEEERNGAYRAFKKFGFEVCADHIDGYLDEIERRKKLELPQYNLLQYISLEQIRHTVDGRVRYFLGMVWKAIMPGLLSHQIKIWTDRAEIRPEFIEELIESLKQLHPLTDHRCVDGDEFLEWWHGFMRKEYDECCDYHSPKKPEGRTFEKYVAPIIKPFARLSTHKKKDNLIHWPPIATTRRKEIFPYDKVILCESDVYQPHGNEYMSGHSESLPKCKHKRTLSVSLTRFLST